MKAERYTDYCTDLGLLMRHDLPLAEAVDLLAAEAGLGSPEARVASMVKSGESLHGSLHSYGFPPWATAVIGAAETAGMPAKGLDLVARQLRDEDAWRTRVTKALAYPLLALGASLVVGLVLFRTMLPTIALLTEELGTTLPMASRIALAVGRAGGTPVVWLPAAGLLAAALWLATRQEYLRQAAARMPGLTGIVRMAEAWRYFGICGTLVRAGIPLHTALEMAVPVVAPEAWRHDVQTIARGVKAGESMGTLAREVTWFPSRAGRVLTVAEASDTVAEGLDALAAHASTILDRRLTALARWLPVGLLALAAATVAFLAQAMLLPAFQIDITP